MKVAYDVPFFANTADNTHCVQASLRMLLKYFEPDQEFSWEELERITAKVEGLATWKSAMWIWLHRRGYEVRVVEGFNAKRFITEGAAYLRDEFGQEAADWQIRMSDVPQEQRLYRELLTLLSIDNRIPQIGDITRFLDQGYLVAASVNSRKLAKKSGYVGHSIVITGYDDGILRLNNPGLPANEGQIVSYEDFEAAWADPNDIAKEMFAIKKLAQ